MKATIENDYVYSEFLPMRADVLETEDGSKTVSGVSCTEITVCGNIKGMLYMLELVGVKGRFQWRKRSPAAEVAKAFEEQGVKTEIMDGDNGSQNQS